MKKILSSFALFGVLATGGISYAENLDVSPENMNEECWAAYRTGNAKVLIKCYKEAIKIYEKQGDYEEVYSAKNHIGVLYSDLKDYKNAEKYYLEALEGAKKIGNKEIEADAYLGLGIIYEQKGDKKKAREYYMKAHELYKSVGSSNEDALRGIKRLDKSK
jgi:tetratricopeptide (TPR) repeat protein